VRLGRVRERIRVLVRRLDPAREVDDEIAHHLEEVVDVLMAEGMDKARAEREARRRFGSVREHRNALVRMNRRGRMMRMAWEMVRRIGFELRGGLRSLARNPGFAVGVVATLALGIGVNGAMFAITDRLLLRAPDHIERPDEVRRILIRRPSMEAGQGYQNSLTYPDLLDLRAVSAVDAAAGFSGPQERTLGRGADATRVQVAGASHDYFTTLGVAPARGRFYTAAEDDVDAAPTAVLDWDFWMRAWGGSPDALGADVEIDGVRHTVVGIAPRGFTGINLTRVDVWVPLEPYGMLNFGSAEFTEMRGFYWMRVIARVEDAGRLPLVEEQATALHLNGREEQVAAGSYNAETRVVTSPLIAGRGPLASDESRVALWLSALAGLVLLIACANVANLMLARAEQRRREDALRMSLGVSRAGLVRATLVESLLVAGLGGVLALGVAHWGGALIRRTLVSDLHWVGSDVDGRLLAFTLGAALLAGLVAGVPPALRSLRGDLATELQNGGRGGSGRRSRVRSGLAVAQVGLSVVLLVSAGLFVRSLQSVRGLDLGVDVDRVVAVTFETETPFGPFSPIEDATRVMMTELHQEGARRARTVGGVTSVSLSSVPFGWSFTEGVRVPGLDSLPRLPGGGPYWAAVDEHYFNTLGLEILQGRAIEASDRGDGVHVVVVSETMARTLWPQASPLGQCLHRGPEDEEVPCTTVVGVVEDATRGSLQEPPYMAYYVPIPASTAPRVLYARTGEGAGDVVTALAQVMRSFSPEVRYARVQTLREVLDPQARSWALGAMLFSAFGVLALMVAAVGLYSLLAFDVADRRRELGIRSALGASKPGLLRGVVFRGVGLGCVGVALGLGVTLVLGPRVEALLFGVTARDPFVLATAALVLVGVSVLAAWIPGLRATGVDPMEALRSE
jgi:predicted permease